MKGIANRHPLGGTPTPGRHHRPLAVGRRRQRGVAPVETILILPFFLLIVLLAFHSTRLMLVKAHVTVEARTTAWRSALFGGPIDGPRCARNDGTRILGHEIQTTCSTEVADGTAFLSNLERERHGQDMIDELLRQAGLNALPQRVEVRASSRIGASQGFGWTLVVEEVHSLDAQPVWTRNDAPLGYDRYLDRVIDSDHIFSGFFSRSR